MSLETECLQADDDPLQHISIKEKKAIRDKMRKDLFKKLNFGELTTWHEISKDPDYQEMRRNVDIKFEHAWEKAYQDYIAGNWSSAGEKLAKLRRHKPDDGPTKVLHEFVNN